MAFKVTWKPVLQMLALKDYHPAFADEAIMVCVNPAPEFWEERQALLREYSKRLVVLQAESSRPDEQQEPDSLNQWMETVFVPGIRSWFARAWSFGDDEWTVEDLNEIDQTDSHLLTWLMARSIEMTLEHQAGRKKA